MGAVQFHHPPVGPVGRVEQTPIGGSLGEGELPLAKRNSPHAHARSTFSTKFSETTTTRSCFKFLVAELKAFMSLYIVSAANFRESILGFTEIGQSFSEIYSSCVSEICRSWISWSQSNTSSKNRHFLTRASSICTMGHFASRNMQKNFCILLVIPLNNTCPISAQ